MLAKIYKFIFVVLAYFLSIGLLATTSTNAQIPMTRRIALVRRDGDFDSLLSELKSKGSRMR